MKIVVQLFVLFLLAVTQLIAQVPQSFSYQAVAYDTEGELLTNQSIGVKIAILKDSASGSILYEETHMTVTNDMGLFSLKIGEGTVTVGNFSSIDWGASLKFLDMSLDPDGGSSYIHMGAIQLLSVPYAIHAATADRIIGRIPESDPFFSTSLASGITATDTANWNSKLDDYTESDPIFAASLAAGITQDDTALWNIIPDIIIETDPVFSSSVAAAITSTDTADWNNKLMSYTETDPVYESSVASDITGTDTTYWNNKLDSFSETDPVYESSIAGGITGADTTYWNDKLDSYTETDPVYEVSIASGITGADTTYWNDKLDNYNETDPVFGLSLAFGLTEADTMYWNDKLDAEVDGSTTNEIQTISREGLNVSLSDGGGSYEDSVNVYTAGDGIDITDKVISNTAAATTYAVGDFAQGGVVFWVDASGQHGLVVAKVDQADESTEIRWYAGTNGYTRANGDGPFAGETNTAVIIAAHVAIGDDGNTYAARMCADLSITEGGVTYSDWYLPSKAELTLIQDIKSTIDATATANGGTALSSNSYWSSTEYSNTEAWRMTMNNGLWYETTKSLSLSMRAIRAF